jgi:hypothetical protein
VLARRVVDLDFDQIGTWFSMREMRLPDRSLFPATGFIISGIAAGFIYYTDSAVALIDCYISNPDTDPQDRSEAIDAITDALIQSAKFHRCKMIKCDTQLDTIKKRALALGFKGIGEHDNFVMEL